MSPHGSDGSRDAHEPPGAEASDGAPGARGAREARAPDVAGALRQARLVTLALAGGVAVLAAVVVLLLSGEGSPDWSGSLDPSVLPWAAAGAAALLLVAPRLRRRIAGAAAPDAHGVVQAWTAGTLVATGLREAVGVGGLVLGLLTGSLPWALGFASVSIAAMLLGWPRGEELRERLRWVEERG